MLVYFGKNWHLRRFTALNKDMPSYFSVVVTVDPKYADALQGAPPSFQQRIAEISSLEQETIRNERARKFKKRTTKNET